MRPGSYHPPMASAIAKEQLLSPADYLARERAAEEKSEYFQGEVFAMAGGTAVHSLISMNVTAELRDRLKGRDCTLYNSDLRVKVSESGLYTYPDGSVVCGQPQFEDADTLLNPLVLIEVLSPASESYDRGRKFEFYRQIASLSTYLLVSQEAPRVEQFVRQQDSQWLWNEAHGMESCLHLSVLAIDLRLEEVFAQVTFEPVSLHR